jgi:hypothetical protein
MSVVATNLPRLVPKAGTAPLASPLPSFELALSMFDFRSAPSIHPTIGLPAEIFVPLRFLRADAAGPAPAGPQIPPTVLSSSCSSLFSVTGRRRSRSSGAEDPAFRPLLELFLIVFLERTPASQQRGRRSRSSGVEDPVEDGATGPGQGGARISPSVLSPRSSLYRPGTC